MRSTDWPGIKEKAYRFVERWKDETDERAWAQSFWSELLSVFGVDAPLKVSFEKKVRNLGGNMDRIDMYWEGVLLVEHKSRGADLTKAESQAFGYIQSLAQDPARPKLPRRVILSDYARFVLFDTGDTEKGIQPTQHEFTIDSLAEHVELFGFLIGEDGTQPISQQELNLKAVELLGTLHDSLEESGYQKDHLDQYMVRLLFCLFADDTGIFPDHQMERILLKTDPNGVDTGATLDLFFDILNTKESDRQTNLPADLASFPYVNGGLFRERLRMPYFDKVMRKKLLDCASFDWSQISPAVFGSLFQSIMEPRERRQYGAHYTSERDIMKVIRPLFLDDLEEEFEKIKNNKAKLAEFQQKLGSLHFLDPACGCGNFLVIAYRELRRLELDVLLRLHPKDAPFLIDTIDHLSLVNVDQFYGIEIEEWPAHIAEVAMWLMDHVMNLKLSATFGRYFVRLPLTKAARIRHANALRIDWNDVLPKDQCSFILGNPPFIGKHLQSDQQSQDTELIWGKETNSGLLDYVTNWYKKASDYMRESRIITGFVSTNSISQGEQVGALWNPLFKNYGAKIHFAHQTFQWESEARGKAHVHVVIIGFALFDTGKKTIYEQSINGESLAIKAGNISPYLIEGGDIAITPRSKPLCAVPACEYGNKPTDGGFLIVEEKDRLHFLAENPEAEKYLRPLLCAEEYLYKIPRWCLWLVNATPSDILKIQGIKDRVTKVKEFRLASTKGQTREKATTPSLFAEIRQPKDRYIIVPRHSSETRQYIPFGYFDPNVIVHDSCSAIPNASPYHFGILSSKMHMAWTKTVCGRIKSDYRYSGKLVYNTYPWPESASDEQKEQVEKAGEHVLNVRDRFNDTILADMYHPNAMPPDLVKAHADLDRAVDKCYRKEPFKSERERVEFLFRLYQELVKV